LKVRIQGIKQISLFSSSFFSTPLLLNFGGSMMLNLFVDLLRSVSSFHSIFGELNPKIFEFLIVFFDVVRVIHDEKVFLIASSSLDSPVK